MASNLYEQPISTPMIAKVKSSTFIDSLQFELVARSQDFLRAVLRDDQGSVCSELETTFAQNETEVTWKGLNDLPYGVYTLELSQGEDQLRLRIVKRV
jgi:hypothetical protein